MSEKHCHRRIQEQFGMEFPNEENSFVIFEAQLLNSSSVVRSSSLTFSESNLNISIFNLRPSFIISKWQSLNINPMFVLHNVPVTTLIKTRKIKSFHILTNWQKSLNNSGNFSHFFSPTETFQAFLVDIYSLAPALREEDRQPEHIGMCYVYPDNLKHTQGALSHPLTSMKFQPIGKITSKTPVVCASPTFYIWVDYLVIQPTPGLEMDFSSSYRNYWSGRDLLPSCEG